MSIACFECIYQLFFCSFFDWLCQHTIAVIIIQSHGKLVASDGMYRKYACLIILDLPRTYYCGIHKVRLNAILYWRRFYKSDNHWILLSYRIVVKRLASPDDLEGTR
jgi:hypothetical protein